MQVNIVYWASINSILITMENARTIFNGTVYNCKLNHFSRNIYFENVYCEMSAIVYHSQCTKFMRRDLKGYVPDQHRKIIGMCYKKNLSTMQYANKS